MRVIYDISVLGLGHYYPSSRTGVFRVVESLAEELAAAHAIHAFAYGETLDSFLRCEKYLDSSAHLNDIPLPAPEIPGIALGTMRRIFEFANAPQPEHASAAAYARHMWARTPRLLRHRCLSRNRTLMQGDIFHTPFYAIPEQLRQNRTLRKVITVHDLIAVRYPQYFKETYSTQLIRDVLASIDGDTWVTCVSKATRDDLCNFHPGVDPEKVFVTPLAASPKFHPVQDASEIAAARSRYGIPDGPYILALSTLEPRKNITQTIRCFSRLVEEGSVDDLSLVLVGHKGWDYAAIFSELRANQQIRDRIIVTGFAEDRHLPALYSGALMFVYPSLYEGFGLPPLEAMQCGVPVITSNTSSLPEVVGDAGIMVDPHDADALCDAMLRLYRAPDLRHELARASLARAAQFSWARCAEQTMAVYEAAGNG